MRKWKKSMMNKNKKNLVAEEEGAVEEAVLEVEVVVEVVEVKLQKLKTNQMEV